MIQPIQVIRCVSNNAGWTGGIPPSPLPPYAGIYLLYGDMCYFALGVQTAHTEKFPNFSNFSITPNTSKNYIIL